MSTVLNSEFTHFNLVIHLSKSQQSAFLFCTFCDVPRFRLSLEILCELHSLQREAVLNFGNLLFAALLQRHCIMSRHLKQAGTRFAGVVFFFWLSGEVKHFVHLIRWTLKAVLCHWGKT